MLSSCTLIDVTKLPHVSIIKNLLTYWEVIDVLLDDT